MQKFTLVLINEKVKQYKLFALLIIILNILVLAILAVTRSEIRYRSIALLALIAVLFLMEYFAKKKKKEFSAKSASTLLIIGAYLSFKLWVPAMVLAFLAVLYIISIRQFVVSVNATHIIYPSFPKRTIQWDELNNIIIRDGLLTLDFKNNKLVQAWVINREDNSGPGEKEFNDFCRAQLESVASSHKTK
jgi:hypothetical protein